MFTNLPLFFAVSATVIVTPGQDTALTIRNTLLGGRRAGFGTAAGVAAGQAVWTVATSLGLAALLLGAPALFRAVRLAGALYLIWLGGQALLGALLGAGAGAGAGSGPAPGRPAARSAFRQGVISNLGNPKMAVFFTSLLPQFVETPRVMPLAALGFAFCTMTLTWLTLYAVAVARAGDLLRERRARRVLEGATGATLGGLGVWAIVDAWRS